MARRTPRQSSEQQSQLAPRAAEETREPSSAGQSTAGRSGGISASLPAILTGVAAVLTACAGLAGVFFGTNVFRSGGSSTEDASGFVLTLPSRPPRRAYIELVHVNPAALVWHRIGSEHVNAVGSLSVRGHASCERGRDN
jgi:hypothetical protein